MGDITPIGLGTWALAGARWGPQPEADSLATIERAVARGVGWLDTAPVYGLGRVEELVGRALAGVGERPLVFTKTGVTWEDQRISRVGRREVLRRQCEESMRRLRTDRLDLCVLHWPPEDGTPVEDAWGALAELAAEGKARWIGVSNFGVELLDRCEAVRHIDAVHAPLSLLDRAAARDVIPWAARHGAAAIVYRPLAGGLLSGAFSAARAAALPADDWRARAPEFRGEGLAAALDLVARLEPIAAGRGCTVAQLAIEWALSVPGVTGAAVGARRPEQVDAWAASAPVAAAQLEERLGPG